jgi:hypothetical protein
MCVDCVLASPRIAQVDPGDEPLPEVVLSQALPPFLQPLTGGHSGAGDHPTPSSPQSTALHLVFQRLAVCAVQSSEMGGCLPCRFQCGRVTAAASFLPRCAPLLSDCGACASTGGRPPVQALISGGLLLPVPVPEAALGGR